MTRNQSKKQNVPEYVDLDHVNIPISSVAQAMLDLRDQPPTSSLVSSEKVKLDSNNESEFDDEEFNDKIEDDCKAVERQNCLNYECQV